MVEHIGRSILFSEPSTPSCCHRLLMCLIVSCTGPQKPALPLLLSARQLLSKFVINSADPTLFKKECVNRFKKLLLHVSPPSDTIFVLWNVASCLIILSTHPDIHAHDMPVNLHPAFTLLPSLNKKFLTHVTFTADSPFKPSAATQK